MTSIHQIRNSLDDLQASADQAQGLDARLEEKTLHIRRRILCENLQSLLTTIERRAVKVALWNSTLSKDLLLNSWPLDKVRSNRGYTQYTPAFLTENMVFFSIDWYGVRGLNISDNEKFRLTYLDEAMTRVETLMRMIKDGGLDGFIDCRADELLHMILGRRGKLLPLIGVDPLKGRTLHTFARRFIDNNPDMKLIIGKNGKYKASNKKNPNSTNLTEDT